MLHRAVWLRHSPCSEAAAASLRSSSQRTATRKNQLRAVHCAGTVPRLLGGPAGLQLVLLPYGVLTKDRGDNAQNSKSRQIIGKNIKQAGKVDVVKRISEEPETGVNEIWHFQYGVTVRNNHLYIQDLNLPVPLWWFRQSPI